METILGTQDEQGSARWLSVNSWPLQDRAGAAIHRCAPRAVRAKARRRTDTSRCAG
jgi:hypothetical protein